MKKIYKVLVMVTLILGVLSNGLALGAERLPNSQTTIEAASMMPHEISATDIELPTNGAAIDSVTLISATEKKNIQAAYYKVLGAIHPVDKKAPDINFQVNLPVKWNNKMVQFGGGGFDGTLVTADGLTCGQGNTDIPPLAQGYVTFGSDSGHAASIWDSQWALNDEALHNFASDQLKKTKDVAMALVRSFYKKKPSQVYFIGGSNGGREALMVTQRFPKDYDGVVAFYPALNWVPKALNDNKNTNILQLNNGIGWISPDEYRLIAETTREYCDGLDGVKDGVISNPTAAETFKKTILEDLSGKLSPAQITTLETFLSPMTFDFPIANNFLKMPGYSISQLLVDENFNQFGSAPMARDGMMEQFSDGVIKYQIVRDESFDLENFKPEEWKKEIWKASTLLDATNPDISAFQKNGGKLIILHGAADQIVALSGTIDYYNKLVKKFGKRPLNNFVKFYIVPGYGHGKGSIFTMGRDLLQDLDHWVVSKKEPGTLVVTDQNEKTKGRTLPLQVYPGYPRYSGNGNVNSAASYVYGSLLNGK